MLNEIQSSKFSTAEATFIKFVRPDVYTKVIRSKRASLIIGAIDSRGTGTLVSGNHSDMPRMSWIRLDERDHNSIG